MRSMHEPMHERREELFLLIQALYHFRTVVPGKLFPEDGGNWPMHQKRRDPPSYYSDLSTHPVTHFGLYYNNVNVDK